MSSARPGGGHDISSNLTALDGRARHHLDEVDVSKMKMRIKEANQKMSSLHVSDKISTLELPSPFSGDRLLRRSTRTAPKSPGAGRSLRLDTTPEALQEMPVKDYVSSKQSLNSAPPGASNTVSPLASPLSGSTSFGSRPGGTPAGGQAAEMQARILALQRSRSKQRPCVPAPASAASPQLTPLQRRSSSSSSANYTSCFPGPMLSKANSRSSVSTFDSVSLESEDDDNSSNSSPAFDKLDSGELRPFPNGGDSSTFAPSQQHRGSSPGSAASTPHASSLQASALPKQPLASNGFDPNTVISPTAASFAASGGGVSLSRASSFRSRQRSSLSARRGMKLDPSALQSSTTSPLSSVSSTPRASVGSLSAKSVEALNSQTKLLGRPPLAAPLAAPQEAGNRGFFRDYRKYIDIETGSLNFAGKACVHARGIEFSSGETFNISIDKLEFISELGSGNYGTVQKVLHTPNGVFMAVKEIRLELDEASLRQIIMELDVLHRCNMPNIIAFYGAFFVEGSVYICMEYMDGGSVNKIYQGGISEKYLKYIVRSVVQGLKQLKEQFNIIHRDVKPTNILCSTSGEVKLCDFGVSGNLVSSLARTNIGCQAYMAPERIKVDRSMMVNSNQPMTYTAESDIWSLGLSIIEMAKGSYPYPSESFASIFSQLNAIVEDPSPALDPSKFSPEACDFVNQLLCKSPNQRPKYADIVKHPWLAKVECTQEEMGAFVEGRLASTSCPPAKPA